MDARQTRCPSTLLEGVENISRAVKYEMKMSSMSLGEGIIWVTYLVMLLPCDVHCLKSLASFRKALHLNGKFIPLPCQIAPSPTCVLNLMFIGPCMIVIVEE